MSHIAERENSYQLAFKAVREQNRKDVVQLNWFDRVREGAMDRFAEKGFPSVKEEEWKYTDVSPIGKTEFAPLIQADGPSIALSEGELETFIYPEARHSRLVFQNGVFRKDLSSLEEVPGLIAVDILDAIATQEFSELVKNHFALAADYNKDAFTALNTSLISSGAFILIPKGARIERPIQIVFLAQPHEVTPLILPRVLIIAEENSSATIIESYSRSIDRKYFTNSVVELFLKNGARVEHYKVQQESREAFHVATTATVLGRNSSYDGTTLNFGGQLSRHNILVTMPEEGAECWVDGLYVVSDGQHMDTHSLIDHQSANCTSHQLYKGILDGKSRAVFNGKIFVRHGAQKTDAMQTNKNLLLSNEARVDTKPQLEIFADDVKCAHGAAVGQIDEEELFYLKTRGIHPDLARNLLTYGFAEEVIGKIKVDSVRAQLDAAVLNRLNTRLEA